MSGRGGRAQRGGQRGGRGGRGRGPGRGTSYSGNGAVKHKGLCAALGMHVFDYGSKGAADQMRNTWEKITHHVGTIYGHDISNELQNKTPVTIAQPQYSAAIIAKHALKETRRQSQGLRLNLAASAQRLALLAEVAAGTDITAPMQLAVLENEIEEAAYQLSVPLSMQLDDSEATSYHNEWRTYRERTTRLEKQRGQAFSMIRGQCMQVLLDKMKHDTDWINASTSYNPLTLFALIEKTILAQTEDQYPYATVYEQECTLYSFSQNSLSNEQWYERFNTRIDVGTAIGVTRQHTVLLEHVAQETGTTFAAQTAAEQKATREKAEERYLSYVFLRQSGKQHHKLKVDLQNDFTTGDDRYPKNRQQTLHLLDKYSKSTVVQTNPSEGTAFAQKGRSPKGQDATFDKKYWQDKECYNCHKKGHPSSHCKESKNNDTDDKTVSSKTSKSSKSSKSSKTSKASKTNSINKAQKRLKKSFATLSTKIDELENESDLSDSESDEEGDSHFQTGTLTGYQMMQHETTLQQTFEKRNADVLFKLGGSKTKLDLRKVVLLDSQSTMDLFCNPHLVKEVTKTSNVMNLQSNGGTMQIRHKASISGYHKQVWFSKFALTNIIALSNLIKQYRVTYDSGDEMFVVHRKTNNLPNMEFKMHSCGLHYYEPTDKDFTFINTVDDNKKAFSKRQLKGAELARTLYATLGYPSIKDFKWVIQSNQIKDCPVTVQDVVTAHQIWGKNIAALKGKTTRHKS
jgi:hypothetical protein